MRVTQKRGGIAEDDGCAMYERYAISVLPKSSIVKRKETAGTVIILPLRAETGGLLIKPAIFMPVSNKRNNFIPSNLVSILYDNRGCVYASEFACEDRNEIIRHVHFCIVRDPDFFSSPTVAAIIKKENDKEDLNIFLVMFGDYRVLSLVLRVKN